jgi:hypothetical protein
MAFHLPTDLPTYLPTSLVEPKSVQLSSTRLSMNLFDPLTFFHLLTWLSLSFIHPIFFHLLISIGVWISFSQFIFICSFRLESEFHSANFFSSAPSVESEFNQPTFSSACLFSWVRNHSANFSIYLTHLVESEIHSAQLFHLLAHLVESEIHSADFFICSLGWVWIHSADIFICSVGWVWIRFWAAWLSSNLGFELTWQPAQLRLKLIRMLRLIWWLVGLLVGWVWIGLWADNEVLLLSPN